MQQSAFGDQNFKNTVLQVSAFKKKLSKNQQTFNRLTSRITKLRKALIDDGARLVQLSSMYNAEIAPLMIDLAKQKIALAKKLAEVHTNSKLTEKQSEEVGQLIFDLLDDGFALVTPDEETKKLYDSLARVSYDESLEEEKQSAKEDLKEHLSNVFGIDVDMDDFDESPEGYAQFKEKLRQQVEERQQQQGEKKKTKKQLAKEASLLEQEAVKKRSIRSIYLSLAKLLHPDTETDEAIKKEKEEIMKELTRAYDENDLTALLQLELKWIATENDHLDKLSDDKLKIYISVLNNQVKELETEKAMQENNPAFGPVLSFLTMNTTDAISRLKYEKEQRAGYNEKMKKHTQALEGSKLRAAIKDCIQAYLKDDTGTDDDTQSFHEMMEILMRRKM